MILFACITVHRRFLDNKMSHTKSHSRRAVLNYVSLRSPESREFGPIKIYLASFGVVVTKLLVHWMMFCFWDLCKTGAKTFNCGRDTPSSGAAFRVDDTFRGASNDQSMVSVCVHIHTYTRTNNNNGNNSPLTRLMSESGNGLWVAMVVVALSLSVEPLQYLWTSQRVVDIAAGWADRQANLSIPGAAYNGRILSKFVNFVINFKYN